MRQVILLDAQDFATLKDGVPMKVALGDGGVLEIAYDKPRIGRPPDDAKEPLAPATSPKDTRRKCLHCGGVFASLSSHMASMHPGKGLSPDGQGIKCRKCPRRYPTKESVFRHEVRRHRDLFTAGKGGAA